MSITTQPNEMLDMILNQTGIPLAQRIRLRAVSHRFRATLDDGLQQENSLVIHVGSPNDLKNLKSDHSTVQPNDLILSVSNFTKEKAIDLIQRLFPNVTELAINSNSLMAWRKATELLDHFARTLTSLKLDGPLKKLPTRVSAIRRLGDAINAIATLSALHLPYGSFAGPLLLYLAPTLSRLERFTFEKPIIQNEANFMAASLSFRCTHLRLVLDKYVFWTTFLFRTTFFFRDVINLTHLHLDYYQDTILQFVLQLPHLMTLTLYDRKGPELDTLLQNIHPLSQVLTQVTFQGISYRRPLEQPASKAFTFPSIKELTLQMNNIYFYEAPFNAQDYLSTLAFWFPNLTTCSLHVSERYHEGILAIEEALPFTVKLLDHLEPTFE